MIARIVRKTKFFVALKKKILNPELRCNKFRAPRLWSNSELRKFAPFFTGSVVNISGWNDSDKEGNKYREYFANASAYSITNYLDDAERGAQDFKGEIKLNLEEELPKNLIKKYDVAFTHTVMEHIYDVHKAFSNICKISRNTVITIVPYIQQLHGMEGDVGDYWRFTPLTMKRLYEENGLKLRYCSSNGKAAKSSIYLFCIGYRDDIYDKKIPYRFDLKIKENAKLSPTNVIGANIIR